jgi:hypothetical protein
MKLSKDRQIQILFAIIIVVLIIVMVFISGNGDDDMLKFGETLTDELTDGSGDVTTAPASTTTTAPAATTTTATPAPATTSGGCYPGLSAKKIQTPLGIQLAWSKCSSEDFQFYKLVKSATNASPSYPNDSVIMSSANTSATSYLDRTVARSMTYYYRVCVVQRLSKVTCGNVASVAY